MAGNPSQDFFLPPGYVRRVANDAFDDTPFIDKVCRYQPEAYVLSDYLLRFNGRNLLIDVGCGSGQKIPVNRDYHVIGIDSHLSNLNAFADRHSDAHVYKIDLNFDLLGLDARLDLSKAVIICADVVEHLTNPSNILDQLAELAAIGAVVIITTPDRDRLHISGRNGPPNNPAHVQEWSLSEFIALIASHGLTVSFSGHTMSDNIERLKNTSIVICESSLRSGISPPEAAKEPQLEPLGIIAAYNDGDIIDQICRWHLGQGLSLHLIDNWSTDETFELMLQIEMEHPGRVIVERYPKDGPEHEYKWTEILDRKAQIAANHPGRWILHIDSDEIRMSPWKNLNLADALRLVSSYGCNKIDFCVVNFFPVRDGFSSQCNPIKFFNYFEFGRHPAHFVQYRGWVQPNNEVVDLSSSGGHDSSFDRGKPFPYRFGLLHYPIRSDDHGRRKIFEDRMKRYSREERRTKGWHNHYDSVSTNQRFLQLPELLTEFNPDNFYEEYLVEVVSDAVRRRGNGSLL